jgi:hypothetical protein
VGQGGQSLILLECPMREMLVFLNCRQLSSGQQCLARRAVPTMPTLAFRSSRALSVVLLLAACSARSPNRPSSPDSSADTANDAPGAADASNVTPTDAGGSGDNDAGGSGVSGSIISCYIEGDPDATCTLPTHCCFGNYNSAHDGACTTAACSYGTIECDGPEDCADGQHCCAHAIMTPDDGLVGYQLVCQASACGPAPQNQEMCQPTASAAGTCSNLNSQCVAAFGNDSDLPPSLHICQ